LQNFVRFEVIVSSCWTCVCVQDGEIWTFSVRAFDSHRPERTVNVNYDGFAEGNFLNAIVV
jgi:hypothetical protein